jgi:hypothetical protein
VIFDDVYMKLREHSDIDLLNVTEELAELPGLILEASEHYAIAQSVADTAKHDREVREAQLFIDIKRVEEKASVDLVRAHTTTDDGVIELKAAERIALQDANMWKSLVGSLQTKQHILRDISQQIIAGFASPTSISKQDGKSWYQKMKERNSAE